MATGYADMQRFIISINSRPLPVNSVVVEKGETKDERINKLWLVLAKGGFSTLSNWFATAHLFQSCQSPGDGTATAVCPGFIRSGLCRAQQNQLYRAS